MSGLPHGHEPETMTDQQRRAAERADRESTPRQARQMARASAQRLRQMQAGAAPKRNGHSTRCVAEARTYDPGDCTSVGWRVQAYSDGRVAITWRSRWQGGRDGQRWIRERAVDPDDPDELTEDALLDHVTLEVDELTGRRHTLDPIDPVESTEWRMTSRGVCVR